MYRKKTLWELIRISLAVMGIEFTYAAITAFVSPILLELGINYNQMSLVWAISPIIGFLLSPIMGTLSDHCRMQLGRRRPFIILFSIFNVIGLLLIPFGQWLSTAIKEVLPFTVSYQVYEQDLRQQSSVKNMAIIVTVVGIVITDYTSDALQNPSRAYLLDVCRIDDHARGLTTFTILAGCGGFIGYLLGSVNWQDTQIVDYSVHNGVFGGHIQVFYTLTAILFIICIVIAITTFKEVPLQISEHMQIDFDIASESNVFCKEFEEATPFQLKQVSYGTIDENSNSNKVRARKRIGPLSKRMSHAKDKSVFTITSAHTDQNLENEQVINAFGNALFRRRRRDNLIRAIGPADIRPPPGSSDSFNSSPSIKSYLKSLWFMPFSLRILCLTNLFCWMAHSTYTLYFTDFVGHVVFGGDPDAPPESEPHILYEDGVRFGCLGMAIYSLSCMFYSFTIEYLIKRFGLKRIYLCSILLDSVSLLLIALLKNKFAVIVLSVSCGIFYATLFTVPYILVAHYHSNNIFEIDSCGDTVPQNQIRGLGTDVSVIGSCVFIAQFLLSVAMGIITQYFTTSTVVIISGSILAMCAFLVSTRVMYLDL
ncbi:hypothetical protein PGB90_010376 [Kerria lacca]